MPGEDGPVGDEGVMDLQKIAVKLFAEDPRAVKPVELIPVFHRWIQGHRVVGTLIDVADYSHLEGGPGVMLVGFEADYALDAAEGPLGLLYSRKTPREGTPADRIRAAFRDAFDAADKLEQEPELKGRLRFKGGEALVIANDRLLAPNSPPAYADLASHVESALAAARPAVSRDGADPRRRLTVVVRASDLRRLA